MIDILLATYNGEAYLEAQIESLLNQDFQDWRLLVRDDGSRDGTSALLKTLSTRLGDRIAFVADDGTNLGPCGNFARLLEESTADYAMLCDQDDIWLPGKVRLTLEKMKEVEAACGAETPVLVHTDLRIVGADLTPVAESGHRYQGIDPEKGDTLGRLLVQNVATGCSVMVNRALRDRALPIPPEALMHDHWLSLVAAAFGQIAYLPTPTILYRQHAANKVGAQSWNPGYAVGLLWKIEALRRMMDRNRMQAGAFYERYRASLLHREREILKAFIRMPDHGLLKKRLDILRHRFFYSGALRNLGWLILC